MKKKTIWLLVALGGLVLLLLKKKAEAVPIPTKLVPLSPAQVMASFRLMPDGHSFGSVYIENAKKIVGDLLDPISGRRRTLKEWWYENPVYLMELFSRYGYKLVGGPVPERVF